MFRSWFIASMLCPMLLIADRSAFADAPAREIADAVLACQFPDGAIARSRAERRQPNCFVTSYCFGGLALARAYELTSDRRYLDSAKRFVDFWMSHQNIEPDRWGIIGTMYDQTESAGQPARPYLYTKGPNADGPGYDASDADPAIIAITAYRIFLCDHDAAYLRKHRDGLDRIGRATIATLDPADGLTWSHPNYKVKYLMDASEAFAGLDSVANIFDALQDPHAADEYRNRAALVRRGIGSLWIASENRYAWAKFKDGKLQAQNWQKWYPDSAAQLWPTVWGAADRDDPRSVAVWREFNQHHPTWPDDNLDWPAAARAAQLHGDANAAQRQIKRILDAKLADDTWPVNAMYWVLATRGPG